MVATAVEAFGKSEKFRVGADPGVAAEFGAVRIEDDPVFAGHFHANFVVGEALGGVKVEDKHQAGPFEYDYLVALVLRAHPRLQ